MTSILRLFEEHRAPDQREGALAPAAVLRAEGEEVNRAVAHLGAHPGGAVFDHFRALDPAGEEDALRSVAQERLRARSPLRVAALAGARGGIGARVEAGVAPLLLGEVAEG